MLGDCDLIRTQKVRRTLDHLDSLLEALRLDLARRHNAIRLHHISCSRKLHPREIKDSFVIEAVDLMDMGVSWIVVGEVRVYGIPFLSTFSRPK